MLAMPRREIHVPAAAVTGATIERVLRLPGIYRRTRQSWLLVRWRHPELGFVPRHTLADGLAATLRALDAA